MENRTKILQHSAAYFQGFDYGAALKVERKMSHLNNAFDRYTSLYRHYNASHFGNKHPGKCLAQGHNKRTCRLISTLNLLNAKRQAGKL